MLELREDCLGIARFTKTDRKLEIMRRDYEKEERLLLCDTGTPGVTAIKCLVISILAFHESYGTQHKLSH
jgi:hypothetical protein